MRTLVLITSNFPYGNGESFIEQELIQLSNDFERVLIISQNNLWEKTRETPENVTVYRYNTSTSLTGFLYLPVLFIVNAGKITEILKEEIEFRLGIKDKLTIKKFFHLYKKVIKALQLKEYIEKILKTERISESIVFYSYWLKTGAHAISMLDHSGSIKIARGHGSDIYEEKTKYGYLPLLKFCAKNLDAIFFISNHGRNYFSEKTGIESSRFYLSYLGTLGPVIKTHDQMKPGKYVIVSCSNIVALKRINLIIDSLELLPSVMEVQWLHFGDGELSHEIGEHAKKKLDGLKNITYKFMGHFSNSELLEFYSANHIDLFLNTSFTEGVPVSLMEAQSFGIPVIATNTGGVKELVKEGTGSLLPVNFEPADLTKLIIFYSQLSLEEVNKVRANAFNNWNSNFKASTNYKDFIMQLNCIFATSKNKTRN
jgi:glycosyltransferase involved in cell wall biosynthesis